MFGVFFFSGHLKGEEKKWHKTGGAHGVMIIIVENGHGDKSSNPGQDWLYFT